MLRKEGWISEVPGSKGENVAANRELSGLRWFPEDHIPRLFSLRLLLLYVWLATTTADRAASGLVVISLYIYKAFLFPFSADDHYDKGYDVYELFFYFRPQLYGWGKDTTESLTDAIKGNNDTRGFCLTVSRLCLVAEKKKRTRCGIGWIGI